MEQWMNSNSRCLTKVKKEDLGLTNANLFFYETDLFLIAKSTINIAYTVANSHSDNIGTHIRTLFSLYHALKSEIELIKDLSDKDKYIDFVLKLKSFNMIATEESNSNDKEKKQEFYDYLYDSFIELPIVDFGENTLTI